MKRAIIGAALGAVLAASLGACAGQIAQGIDAVAGTTVTQKTAGAALAAYDAAEDLAIDYLDLPLCGTSQSTVSNACRNKGASDTLNAKLDIADAAADALLADIQAAHAAGKGVGIVKSAYDAVVSATSAVQTATPQGAN